MGSFGGFYKGDKKKQKKDNKDNKSMNTSSAPVFELPKLIEKKKKKWE